MGCGVLEPVVLISDLRSMGLLTETLYIFSEPVIKNVLCVKIGLTSKSLKIWGSGGTTVISWNVRQVCTADGIYRNAVFLLNPSL